MSFQVNSPLVLIQCQPYGITWTGGVAPFYLTITKGGDISSIVKNFGAQNEEKIPWIVNQPVGSTVTFVVTDFQGNTATSASSPPITKGTSDDCMKGNGTDTSPSGPDNNTSTPDAHTGTPPSSSGSAPANHGDNINNPTDPSTPPASAPTSQGVDPDTAARHPSKSPVSSARPSSKLMRSGAVLLLLGVAGLLTLTS